MKKVGVALLGLGTVGGGTYRILTQNKEMFKKTQGMDVSVLHILEKNMDRVKMFGVDPSIVSTTLTM
jgi:homoserine dehydrogenase